MKAITIRQPWASLITLGVKTIETRSSPTKYRGPLAIHAGAHRPRDLWFSSQADVEFPPEFSPLYDYDRCVNALESADGEWWRYRWNGPLGAVIATATLADCVPMVSCKSRGGWTQPDQLIVHDDMLRVVRRVSHPAPGFASPGYYVNNYQNERPYGDFQPGRWAWLLEDVHPIDPVPAKGRQGLWNWDGAA